MFALICHPGVASHLVLQNVQGSSPRFSLWGPQWCPCVAPLFSLQYCPSAFRSLFGAFGPPLRCPPSTSVPTRSPHIRPIVALAPHSSASSARVSSTHLPGLPLPPGVVCICVCPYPSPVSLPSHFPFFLPLTSSLLPHPLLSWSPHLLSFLFLGPAACLLHGPLCL